MDSYRFFRGAFRGAALVRDNEWEAEAASSSLGAVAVSDSATDFLGPPKHVISLLFWQWRTPEHIRIVFLLLLYRQILYNIVTRHGRSS